LSGINRKQEKSFENGHLEEGKACTHRQWEVFGGNIIEEKQNAPSNNQIIRVHPLGADLRRFFLKLKKLRNPA
jgi:hypothetical protein